MFQHFTFFIDFDNTLSDNDKLKIRIKDEMAKKYGLDVAESYMEEFNLVRQDKGYVDIQETIKRVSEKFNNQDLENRIHQFFDSFDFKKCLFNNSGKVVKHLQKYGNVVILTEGDKHAQAVKIKSSGIWDLVNGNVEIPLKNKVDHLFKILNKYPADTYYFIEDKPEILKEILDEKKKNLKTIHVCQGHYSPVCKKEKFDLTIESLDKLLEFSFPL